MLKESADPSETTEESTMLVYLILLFLTQDKLLEQSKDLKEEKSEDLKEFATTENATTTHTTLTDIEELTTKLKDIEELTTEE